MAKKKKYQRLSKAELIRKLEAMEETSKVDRELQGVLHDLHVHQEEVRAQNEQLLEVKRSLEQSRDRYADLYDFAPIAYITLNIDGVVKEINLTGTTLLDHERSHIIGMPFASYVHDKDRSLFFAHLRRCRGGAAESKEGVRSEMRLVSRKRRVFPAELFSRAWPDGPVAYQTVISDLTEQKTIEEEKRQLILREQAARAAAEAKDEFLAVVSHELRTPLTAILLWAKLLRSGHVTANQEEVALAAIEHSASAQEQLIEDLLDISRLVSGRLRLEIREADIVGVIQEALDTVRPAAELKGVQLASDFGSQLGTARIDPDRIRQVVWNLVHNAVKFTPAGGRVTLALHRSRSALTISVNDTGRGIAREFLPHVFERFRQADAGSTRTHGGLGLGLAIAKQLVELHGGTIQVESAGNGKGAAFTVELPTATSISRPAKASQEPRRAAVENFVARPVLRDARILLVDDDPYTRDVVAWLLEQCSAKVTTVDSARAALAEIERMPQAPAQGQPLPFHLIISDIAMPDQDGYELIRQVRKLESARGAAPVPAIALTAYVRERHREQALAAGFAEYIPKPIDPDKLIEAAVRLLQEHARGVVDSFQRKKI